MAVALPPPAASHEGKDSPDLLNATPMTRVDIEATRLAMTLAFASGVSGGLFTDALDRARMAPSTWQPESFANDLFLSHFVSQCFRIRAAGNEPIVSTSHLARVLSRPPSDARSVEHRRAITAELQRTPELRAALERLYRLLCRFRTLLEGAGGAGWDVNRRQLDVLQVGRDVIECMVHDFTGARSGLSRVAVFGQRVASGEPFQSLCDLLRYDENLATLDLKVGVGADGRIRGFRIVSVQTNASNPFVTSPWQRWLAKLELFARGFSFGDSEVMARLIDAVFEGIQNDFVPFVQLLGDVEFYLGALGFADVARAAGHAVCLPDLVRADEPVRFEALFNPLLLSLGTKVVPCDLVLDRHDTTTLITGPNSGGKTRLLQSLGLAQVLAQSGVFIPARAGSVALCPGLVVSLIQETKADQAEGRLGMELVRIRALFERLPKGAMVILDELCSGTNPSEGEEIFELVVRMLTKLTPQVFITTHFLAFAATLERESRIPELRFLQVELGENHEPTYQFVGGVARTSLAGHAAARLGVTAEQLAALIERNLSKPEVLATPGELIVHGHVPDHDQDEPGLAARVRASVDKGMRQGSNLDRRWTVVFRLAVLVGVVGALISFSVLRKREEASLEESRAALLEAVSKHRAALASADMFTLDRAFTVLLRSGGPYEGDLVTPEVRGVDTLAAFLSRPMIYLRGPLEAFRSEEALEHAALQSRQEEFALCLLDPPPSRTEKALLERIRDGSRLRDNAANVHRFYDLAAGMPLLKTSWKTRVKTTQKADELDRLGRELRAAHLEETTAAARARLLLFVADEKGGGTGPTELDGERPHDVRVTLFDLEQGRALLRLRKHVDPSGFSDRGRANHASGLDACVLSLAVRETAEKASVTAAD